MGGTGKVSAGTPSRLRTFDPVRLADLEYRAWVGYYLRRWPQVLIASVGLVRAGFGMDWYLTSARGGRSVRPPDLCPATSRGVPAQPAASALSRQKTLPAHDDGGAPGRQHRCYGNDISRNRSGRRQE